MFALQPFVRIDLIYFSSRRNVIVQSSFFVRCSLTASQAFCGVAFYGRRRRRIERVPNENSSKWRAQFRFIFIFNVAVFYFRGIRTAPRRRSLSPARQNEGRRASEMAKIFSIVWLVRKWLAVLQILQWSPFIYRTLARIQCKAKTSLAFRGLFFFLAALRSHFTRASMVWRSRAAIVFPKP